MTYDLQDVSYSESIESVLNLISISYQEEFEALMVYKGQNQRENFLK